MMEKTRLCLVGFATREQTHNVSDEIYVILFRTSIWQQGTEKETMKENIKISYWGVIVLNLGDNPVILNNIWDATVDQHNW